MSLRERVRRLISSSGDAVPAERLSAQDQEAILELAFLVMAADGVLRPEELEAFEGVVEGLRALRSPSERDAPEPSGAALLERLSVKAIGADLDQQVRELAARLSRASARQLAYRIAVTLATVDRDVSDDEFQLDLTLIDALELSNAEADELAAEAKRALSE